MPVPVVIAPVTGSVNDTVCELSERNWFGDMPTPGSLYPGNPASNCGTDKEVPDVLLPPRPHWNVLPVMFRPNCTPKALAAVVFISINVQCSTIRGTFLTFT